MTCHLKFVSIVWSCLISGAVIYYSGVVDFRALSPAAFFPGEKDPLPPRIPAFKKEEPHAATDMADQANFTFFETLNDPNNEKYVDLTGATRVLRAGDAHTGVKEEFARSNVRELAFGPAQEKTAAAPAAPLEEAAVESDNKVKYEVQAEMFREFDLAVSLVKKLRRKGYAAYMTALQGGAGNNVWYRVYLGKYAEHDKAIEDMLKAQKEDGLSNMTVLKRG